MALRRTQVILCFREVSDRIHRSPSQQRYVHDCTCSLHIHNYTHIRKFPEMGVPQISPNHPFLWDFPLKTEKKLGYPHLWHPPIFLNGENDEQPWDFKVPDFDTTDVLFPLVDEWCDSKPFTCPRRWAEVCKSTLTHSSSMRKPSENGYLANPSFNLPESWG